MDVHREWIAMSSPRHELTSPHCQIKCVCGREQCAAHAFSCARSALPSAQQVCSACAGVSGEAAACADFHVTVGVCHARPGAPVCLRCMQPASARVPCLHHMSEPLHALLHAAGSHALLGSDYHCYLHRVPVSPGS